MKTAHKSLLLLALMGGVITASAVLAAEGSALNATKYTSIDRIARTTMNNAMVAPRGQSNGFQSVALTAMR